MPLETRIMMQVSRLPRCERSAAAAAAAGKRLGPRLFGKGLPSREVTDKTLTTLAKQLHDLSAVSPNSELSLNVIAGEGEKMGLYLDLDPVYTRAIGEEKASIDVLSAGLQRVVTGFLVHYFTLLVQSHLDANADARPSAPTETFIHALFAPRPALASKGVTADGKEQYKHGCHVYVGELRAGKADHEIAFTETVDYFRSSAADLSDAVSVLMNVYHIKRDQCAGIFDIGPIKSGSVLLPGCRKETGYVTYYPTKVLRFRIAIVGSKLAVSYDSEVDYSPAAESSFARFFPIGCIKPLIEVDTPFSGRPVDLPQCIVEQMEEAERLSFVEEIHISGNREAARIVDLLQLIPFDRVADPSTGHDFRLPLVSAVVHSLKPAGEESIQLAQRILEWYFGQRRLDGAPDWQKPDHIAGRIIEAVNDGPQQYVNICWIRKRAREAGPEAEAAVEEIEKRSSERSVYDLLRMLFFEFLKLNKGPSRSTVISHYRAADILKVIVGRDYILCGGSVKNGDWYKYCDDPRPSFCCKKWRRLADVEIELLSDFRSKVVPTLDTIIADAERGEGRSRFAPLQDLGTARAIAAAVNGGITFPLFLSCVKDAMGGTFFIRGAISHFSSCCADVNDEFRSKLDMLPDLTGCLNGILRFEAKPFKVTLLDGDNRDLPVSRSVDARYRTDLTDDSPTVKRVMHMLREIICDRAEFDYVMTVMAGVIFSGRRFEKLYIIFGSGGDGKTTLLNAFVSLAGVDVMTPCHYGAHGEPRMFQNEKTDPNGHDGGSVHLYGGPRIGDFSEPDSDHPWLVESAIKSFLNGSAKMVRGLHQAARSLENRVTPFILVNNVLEFRGQVTDGGQRRVTCLCMREKFKPASEIHRFNGDPHYHAIDLSCANLFSDTGSASVATATAASGQAGASASSLPPTAREMREALMWILINRYLPSFYDLYDANPDNIPIPSGFREMTSRFIGRHARIIDDFAIATMEEDVTGLIPLSEFLDRFTKWYHRTQRGSIRDVRRKRAAQAGAAAAASASASASEKLADYDEWTRDVIQMLSSSMLAPKVVSYTESGDYVPKLANELVMEPAGSLYIRHWVWKKRASATTSTTASTTASTAEPSQNKSEE